MADITQTAHIVISDLIRNQAPDIPEEAVGLILALDYITFIGREERQRIVTVAFLKLTQEVIRKVLPPVS